jgi:LPS sulfotransferase NodH
VLDLRRWARADPRRSVPHVQPFLGAEFDTSAPERRQTYVVCSTPRSGSTFFCQSLISTGVAGVPIEYFNPLWRSILSERWGCGPGLAAYADELKVRRVGANGVFGTKLHWHQLEAIHAEARGRRRSEGSLDEHVRFVDELFGGRPTYVRIRRDDMNRQAISLWTAEYTGVWARARSVDRPPSIRVPYSFAGIQRCRFRIALAEMQWDRYLRSAGVSPIEVFYEDLTASYAATMATVLDRLMPGGSAGSSPPRSVVAPLASPRSEELLQRFLDDLRRRASASLHRPLVWRARAVLGRRFGRRSAA